MKRISVLLVIAIWGLTAAPVAATGNAEECAARPVIVSLAHRIFEDRETLRASRSRLRRFIHSRFVTDAAYLLIHYGDLDRAAAVALVDQIVDEKLVGAQELQHAFLIASGQFDFDELEDDRAFEHPNVSVWRSLILSDDGVRFFQLAREKMPDWHLPKTTPLEDWISYYAVRSIADVPDTVRAKVAATAERLGEISAALMLLADQESAPSVRFVPQKLTG